MVADYLAVLTKYMLVEYFCQIGDLYASRIPCRIAIVQLEHLARSRAFYASRVLGRIRGIYASRVY